MATPGFSRASHVEFASATSGWRRCFAATSAQYFGGVPREVLYDNVRTVVSQRDHNGPV